jgi:hypothetical protein
MGSRQPHRDVAGAAMFAGALIGFAVGALEGIHGHELASPFVLPFVGALCGVVVAGLPFLFLSARRRRVNYRLREAHHQEFRVAARDGWIDDIDLAETRRRS